MIFLSMLMNGRGVIMKEFNNFSTQYRQDTQKEFTAMRGIFLIQYFKTEF
jgi:hypothetical protein